MSYTITNKLTGEMHPEIYANPVTKEILLWDHRSGVNPSNFWQDGFIHVGNGHSSTPFVGKWRLFCPGDVSHQYVVKHPNAHLIDWDELAQSMKNAPQPEIDKQQQEEDLAKGLRAWKRGWNEFEGARFGQAYVDC